MANTDGYQMDYQLDQGMLDPRRPHTSVVRFDTGSQLPRKTGNQQPPLTPRRATGTREFTQPRQGQTGQTTTGRQPRFTPQPPPRPEKKESQHSRAHWLVPAGVGMIAMLVLWVVGSSALAWGMQRYNDYRYGNPRTYQTDEVVGHGDSKLHPSHFIAMNLNHQAVVIELMAGDPGKSVSYVAPVYIVGDDGLAPVTVEFRDVNGDAKADMIVTIHLTNQNQVYVFINDGAKFRPSNASDKMHL
ncbi:MAG: hypothetical protein NVS2B12_10700 [Ktedonobacteraceae bacterium]